MPSYAILGCGLSAQAVISDLFARGETDFTVYVRAGEVDAVRERFPGVRVTDAWDPGGHTRPFGVQREPAAERPARRVRLRLRYGTAHAQPL